jgi:phage-related holin
MSEMNRRIFSKSSLAFGGAFAVCGYLAAEANSLLKDANRLGFPVPDVKDV